MALPQLKLVNEKHAGFDFGTRDATRRVFEHWLYMSGRSPLRCKLGPQRRQVIDAALAIGYSPDQLMQAIEGMAADPLGDVDKPRMRDAMREIEWLLAREARIERWAEAGARLRERVSGGALDQCVDDAASRPMDTAALQAEEQARSALRERARRMREGLDA